MAAARPRHKDKDSEAILRDAEQAGWRVRKTKKQHYRLQCPPECGQHHITMPSTPSDRRAMKNFKSGMRKCERSVL